MAAFVLLPESFAADRPAALKRGDEPSAAKYIEGVATQWMVSEQLVALRLRRMGWISGALYRNLSASYAARWMTFKENTKLSNREKEGGPSYYVLKQSRLGDFLMGIVRRTVRESRLTHTRAAKVLGVTAYSVEPLLRQFEKSSASLAREGTHEGCSICSMLT
jgi:Zn-dependent peptidase ImmA (M78 family)